MTNEERIEYINNIHNNYIEQLIKADEEYAKLLDKLKRIKKYCKDNIQYYDDGNGEYQGEDCCCDGFVILKIIGDDINE